MRTLFRYFALFIICLSLSGCFTWRRMADDTKQVPITGPGAAIMPLTSTITSSAQNVALLLPLQGVLDGAGQAVRDGFITAYNNDNSAEKPAHITVIDTSNQSIIDAYNNALKANADIIVGPLAKNDIQALIQAKVISIPTLALNYVDSNTAVPAKLYQFGLSPLDEARQAAALARQAGKRNAIIIVPDNNWGQMLAQTYQDEWQTAGGQVVTKLFFSENSETLNQQIQTIVNKYKQNFDIILMAASPQMARQIKPLLKFYYAGDIPVYATSLVYTGILQPAFDNDLNGITFCDTPWTLTNAVVANELKQQINLFWPANFKVNARLYALGIDAYRLIKQLPQLTSAQQTINGATGVLFLNKQHLIVRQLTCAQFQRGIPVLLTSDANNTAANTNQSAATSSDSNDTVNDSTTNNDIYENDSGDEQN